MIPKEKFTKYLLVAKGKVEAFIRAGFNVSTESAREVTAADIMKQIEDELPYVGAYPSDPLTKEQNVGPRFTVPIGIFLPDGNVGLLETQWAIDYGSDIPRFLTAWLKV